MKVLLAGAYGKLGSDILKELVKKGYEVIACDLAKHEIVGLDETKVKFYKIDVAKKESLKGIFDNVDVCISTVGLTTSSKTLTNYDIDYQGNLNILDEAKAANVKYFTYISVIRADEGKDVPMVNAKYLFELKLKESGLTYVIHRPTGYFYDIVKVFKPMIEKGSVSLLGKKKVSCNVIDTPDFAEFIVTHMFDKNICFNIGGKETYSYEEIARMCFDAEGKEAVIKHAPSWLFSILAKLPKNKKNGKAAIIKFSKFTLSQDMIGDTKYGTHSFKQYIYEHLKKEAK